MQDSEAGRLTQIKRGNLLTKNPKIKMLAIKRPATKPGKGESKKKKNLRDTNQEATGNKSKKKKNEGTQRENTRQQTLKTEKGKEGRKEKHR